MTVVHDHECMKNEKTNINKSMNNLKENIEIMKLTSTEHAEQKCKSNSSFSCRMIIKNSFFLLSFCTFLPS